MAGGFGASILAACVLSACCALAPSASPSSSPVAVETPAPFVGGVDELLAQADRHLGASVHVGGVIDFVAEGGPSFVLVPAPGQVGIVVLELDEPADESQTFRNHEGSTAEVEGTLYDLTPENVDLADLQSIEGHAFVHVFDGTGIRYLIIGHTVSVD